MVRLIQAFLLAVFASSVQASLCPYSWLQHGNSCYKIGNDNNTRSWVDSRTQCLNMGADLISIDTTAERDWLLSQIPRLVTQSHNSYHNWWLGFNVRMDGQTWTEANGTAADISVLGGKWLPNQPRVDSSYQCVLLRDTKFLVDRCTSGHHHICERAVGQPLTCDPGWTLYGKMCYKHFRSPAPYRNVKSACQRYGGSPPRIWDADMQRSVWEWTRLQNANIWLDLKSTQSGTTFLYDWGNGTALTSPTYWNTRPSNLKANWCVEMIVTRSMTRSWNPTDCNGRRQYTCQKPEGTCPTGWLQLLNMCYNIYSTRPMSFNASQSFCASLGTGATLAVINTADVSNFLTPYIHNSLADGAHQIWIGLTDNNHDTGPWKFNNGPNLGRFNNWAHNPPRNTHNRQDCVYINTNDVHGKWQTTSNCAAPHHMVCQIPTNHAIRTSTPPPPVRYTCDPHSGFVKYGSTCLLLNQQDKTWDQARAACKAKNADLVKITSNSINNFINGRIRSHQGNYWIGLHDRQLENVFKWLDDTNNATFFNWRSGEPNNHNGNENCVYISGRSGFKWNDSPCASKLHFICQKPAIRDGHPPTTTTQRPWSPNCGPYWEDDPNSYSCYMFNTDRLTWADARTACQSRGGHLLSINSLEEQFYVNGRISSLNMNFFWIGANDLATESGWRWQDGSPMSFLNWHAGEPNNLHNEDCVVVSKKDGTWFDFQCNADRYGYVCEKMGKNTPKPTPAVTSPASVPAGKVWGCPRGWSGFQGYCYQLTVSAGTFQQARIACGQRGAQLASIHSDPENKFVYSLFPRGSNIDAWIGLNDLVHEDTFTWTDMSPVTFTKWKTHEPNNEHNEDCVVIYHGPGGVWNDAQCDNRQEAFICKRPMSLQNKADIQMLQGCTHGGLGFRAQCYLYISGPTKNWQAAQNDCHHRHGNLATVNDRHIQAFLSAELVYRAGAGYWIGLKNNGSGNTYMWATGYSVDFTSWSETHTGNERRTCVGMGTGRPVGLWSNFPCNKNLPYICEYPRQGFTTPPPTPPTTTPRTPCPHGWRAYRSQCIQAFNFTLDQRLSWTDARSYCQNLGGDLVTISNNNMQNWLFTRVLLNTTDTQNWWIGLNDRDSEDGHVWADGSAVAYTNWDNGEPNDYGNREDCVEWVLPKNKWNDDVCDVAQNFICSVPRGTIITTTVTPPTGVTSTLCQNSTWLYYSGFCYILSPQDGPDSQKTWYDARRTCNMYGGDLASVQSVDENSFLTYAMSRHSKYWFWIGLNDLSGSYQWTDGSPVTFVSWRMNEPNDALGEESCVESTSRGDWNDNNCQDQRAYVCKQLPGTATPKRVSLPTPVGGCPAGFHSIPILEKCYRVDGVTSDTKKNFTDAYTACNNMVPSAKLASVHNYIEERYLMTLTAKLPTPVWIGLNDIKRRNYFEWHDNSEVDYTHWGPHQPDENIHSNNPDDRRDCVMMNSSPRYAGNWNDNKCANKFAYICETTRAPSIPTLSPDTTGCTVAGYANHKGNCYKYFDTPKQWQDARTQCQNDGGDLVSVTDRFAQALVSLLRMPDMKHARNVSQIWMGMQISSGSKTYMWTNGWPVRFTKWADGEPDDTGSCVKMDQQGKWHDQPCSSSYPFICQINTGTPPPTTSTIAGTCDQGWSPYGEYCYQVVTSNQRSWPEARYACDFMGAKLASIHSQQEMFFIFNLFSSAVSAGADNTVDVWVGLSKGFGSGFAWSDQTEMEFENWATGEPSDTDNNDHQDCVQAAMADGTWNDVDCFDSNYFVCKALKQHKTTLQFGATTSVPSPVHTTPKLNPGNTQTLRPSQGNPNQPRNTPVVGPPSVNKPSQRPPTQSPGTQHPTKYGISGSSTLPPGGTFSGQHSGNDGGNSSSDLSGGAIAGIVIAVLAIVAVTGVAVFYIRSRNLLNSPINGLGFDNALYSKSKGSADESGKGSISFGYEDDHTTA